jgi:hypothetical protein
MDPFSDLMAEALRKELRCLWDDLMGVYGSGGTWSIRCADLAERIVELSNLVGAVSWEELPIPLLTGGVYEKVMRDGGLAYVPIDWDEVARAEVALSTAPLRPAQVPD